MTDVPALVTLHVWGVASRHVPSALLRMATHRRAVRGGPARPAFAKLLGTGEGRTFTVRDSDPRHWALLATWGSASDAAEFEDGPVVRSWSRISTERLRVDLRPVTSKGLWSGRQPFGDPVPSRERLGGGPVAAITRARLVPRHLLTFWRAVPPVSADLHRGGGLRLAIGIGEAPIGLQGTFSLWASGEALTDFAHRRAPHVEAVRHTAELGWYAEELFARFAVVGVQGTYEGREP